MDLLFKREHTPGKLARVNFKLWGKLELNDDEQAIVKRYRFDEAVLIEVIQPGLLRQTIIIGIVIFLDLSRFAASPLVAFIAAKETNYGTETYGRIPCRCGADRVDEWSDTQTGSV